MRLPLSWTNIDGIAVPAAESVFTVDSLREIVEDRSRGGRVPVRGQRPL